MAWSDLYEFPLWLLARPQQALFQGAKAGSEAAPGYGQYLEQKGFSPASAAVYGGLASAIPFARGAWKGLTGQESDVRGSQLAAGNEIIGIGLDFTADPLALAGMIATKAPQMLRTAKNVATYAGTPYESILNKVNPTGLKRILSMDIPMPYREGNPLQINVEGNISPKLREIIKGWMTDPEVGSTPGWWNRLYSSKAQEAPGVIAVNARNLPVNVPHERFHWLWDMWDSTKNGKLIPNYQTAIDAFRTQFPKISKGIDLEYPKLGHAKWLEEALATLIEDLPRTFQLPNSSLGNIMRRAINAPAESISRAPFSDTMWSLYAGPIQRAIRLGADVKGSTGTGQYDAYLGE